MRRKLEKETPWVIVWLHQCTNTLVSSPERSLCKFNAYRSIMAMI